MEVNSANQAPAKTEEKKKQGKITVPVLLLLLFVEGLGHRKKVILLVVLLLVLALVVANIIGYMITKKPIIAFIPIPGRISPPRYLFSIYGLSGEGALRNPLGVAVGPSGKIYVVDTNNSRVQVFDNRGKFITYLGKRDPKEGFETPVYIAVDRNEKIYVSDRGLGVVRIFSSDGKFLSDYIPNNDEKFAWAPLALAFDEKDNFYVTDVGLQRVLVFSKLHKLKLAFGKEGEKEGQFAFANGIAVDSEGKIYVADSNNSRIQVFDAKGRLQKVINTGGLPRGIGVGSRDEIYVVETLGHEILAYDAEGKSLFGFGKLGLGDGEFQFPNALAIDRYGKMYISDRENSRIQVWGP